MDHLHTSEDCQWCAVAGIAFFVAILLAVLIAGMVG